jgi:hypothetical protein
MPSSVSSLPFRSQCAALTSIEMFEVEGVVPSTTASKHFAVDDANTVSYSTESLNALLKNDSLKSLHCVIVNMLSQEPLYQCRHNTSYHSALQRKSVVEWTFQIVDQYELEGDIAIIAISYFDRYMAVSRGFINPSVFNLIALCSLQLAVKVHVASSRKKLRALAALSSSDFDAATILDGEYQLLIALSWKLHPPTATSLISNVVLLVSQVIPGIAHYISTRTVASVAWAHLKSASKKQNLATTKPSVMAITALSRAVDYLSIAADPAALKYYEAFLKMMHYLFPLTAGQPPPKP